MRSGMRLFGKGRDFSMKKKNVTKKWQKNSKQKSSKQKMIALLLCGVMTVSALTGCGAKKQETNFSEQLQKGRYVEEEVSLPKECEDSNIRQIFRQKEEVHLLTQTDVSGQSKLQEWKLTEDGSFQEVTEEWLSSVNVPYGEYGKLKLMQDEAGTQYLYASLYDEAGDFYQGHLWRSEGTEAVEITPEKWTEMDETYGFYDYPSDITLTEGGLLVSYSFLSIDCFQAQDGALVSSRTPEAYYGDWIESVGGKVYQWTMDDMGNADGLVSWQPGKENEAVTIPFSQGKMSYAYFSILEDGTAIAADADGFFRCEKDGTDWKKLINGADTGFSLTNLWCKGMVALSDDESDGIFYALFGSEGGTKVMQYRYDPDAVIEVTETLTMYSVTESFLLQQAATLYHREHPEVMIEIENGYSKMESYSDNLDYDQIYQDLNTALMAGKGADILVMDGLNLDSYASKGLLADIDEIVAPLEADGSLLANVTGAYRSGDGKRYAVPLQFEMTFAVGRDLAETEMDSMESLATTLEQKEESYMGPLTVSELVNQFYPYFAEEIVQEKQLQREALAVRLQQLKTIADNCGILEKRGKDERAYNIWDLPFRSKLAFYEADGFNGAMLPISVANLVNGTYTCFEETFSPKYEIGINSKSAHLETAKDFLRFALSEEVQSTDYYEGFPVNVHSLEVIAGRDRSDAEAYTTIEIEEGMYEEFKIADFSEEDAGKLKEVCKTVSVRAKKDTQIRDVLTEELPAYLNGTRSLEETLDAIENGLKMYLAE